MHIPIWIQRSTKKWELNITLQINQAQSSGKGKIEMVKPTLSGDPTPVAGAMVKADWIRYYDPDAPLPDFTFQLQSWDTANKSGELNNFSVCTTWGSYDKHYRICEQHFTIGGVQNQ